MEIFFIFRLFNKVPKVLIPAFWFTQTVELNEDIAKVAKVRNKTDRLSIDDQFELKISIKFKFNFNGI